jgi:GH35 family endo-1,4-beta-xylanase
MVRDPATWPRLEKYIKDIISTFRDDRRVWVWDLYNEPTNGGLGDVSLPLSEKVFVWAREINPTQPLTLGTWSRNTKLNDIIFRHSDIITFHNYSKAEHLRDAIGALKKHGRPIINTEWLNRPTGSLVATCLPVFAAENVGCMH